jgi:arginine/lysine/ornithine decarboxylase
MSITPVYLESQKLDYHYYAGLPESELKALLRKEKDATRHEKLQVLYWLKTQTVETVLSAAVRRGKTSYHNTKMVV